MKQTISSPASRNGRRNKKHSEFCFHVLSSGYFLEDNIKSVPNDLGSYDSRYNLLPCNCLGYQKNRTNLRFVSLPISLNPDVQCQLFSEVRSSYASNQGMVCFYESLCGRLFSFRAHLHPSTLTHLQRRYQMGCKAIWERHCSNVASARCNNSTGQNAWNWFRSDVADASLSLDVNGPLRLFMKLTLYKMDVLALWPLTLTRFKISAHWEGVQQLKWFKITHVKTSKFLKNSKNSQHFGSRFIVSTRKVIAEAVKRLSKVLSTQNKSEAENVYCMGKK